MYSSSSSSEDYRKYTAFPNNKLKDVVRKVSSFFNNVAARLPKSKKALKKELKRYRIQAEFYESEVASAAARLSHRDFEITRMKKTVSSLEVRKGN